MMNHNELDNTGAIAQLCNHAKEEYSIPKQLYEDQNVKRGLRNSDAIVLAQGLEIAQGEKQFI